MIRGEARTPRPFVNRTEEMKRLRQALRYDGKQKPVLTFTGIGGMGKTALRIAFEEHVLKPKKLPYAVLDYDGDPNLRPIEATLRAIRRQLGRHKVKTPVFDFLYARYFELSMGVKLTAKNCPPELEDVATILDGIPVVGNVTQILYGLGRLGLSVRERVQHKEWLYRIRELEPREVLNLLPQVLAEDLEEATSVQSPKTLKSSGFRVALLLDAYERLAESQVDDTLHRRLLLLTPHLLRVIFTRDPLPWEHRFPEEWKGKITHFPSLGDLTRKDAVLFLAKKSVDNPELQDYLWELTGGYPLHLELCADISREIEETTGKEPEIQDFEWAASAEDLTEELVGRLLRQLNSDERDLMGLAAYPRWVSDEILEELSSVPESVDRIIGKLIRLSMFSPHPEIPEAYVIRKEVRACLLLQQRKKRLWRKRHAALSAFHRALWEESQSPHHLREAIYHRFYENPDRAMKMFEENFWQLLDRFSFGEAEGLLESIPTETLTETQKRRADYARARFLASTMESQESLLTAKNIYAALVTSETDEASLAEYLFSFGSLLRVLGEYGKALEYHQKSLAIRLRFHGKEHPDVADSYRNIGIICYCQGQYVEAVEYLHKSLDMHMKVSGGDHPDVATSYNDTGIVYYDQGEYGKAVECYRESLAMLLRAYGEEHLKVAISYNNIGNVYSKQGEYDKALEHYQKSLAIRLKVQGEEHPGVAGSYNNIGVIYDEQGEHERALECYHRALTICLDVYGQEHPQVAKSYSNIGIAWEGRGRYGDALKYHQKALAIRLELHGDEHPDVANSYNNIGEVYCSQGKYGQAFNFHQKSLAIRLKVCPEEHPAVAESYHNIGIVRRQQGDYKKALEYFEKSLTILLKVHGEVHRAVAGSYEEIARTLWALKREKDARERIQQSIDMHCKLGFWKDGLHGLETLTGWLEEKRRQKEAEETRAKAQKIRKEHHLT